MRVMTYRVSLILLSVCLGWCVQSFFESSTVTLQLHVLGNKMMFFINGSEVAEALKEIDGKLQSESGPLRVFIKPSDRPQQSREGRSEEKHW